MAVLSLTWKSPYIDKTVFILRRGPVDDISGCLIYRWIAVPLVEGKSASLHCIDGSGGRRGTCPMASSPIAGDPGYATSLYLTGWSVNGLTESH